MTLTRVILLALLLLHCLQPVRSSAKAPAPKSVESQPAARDQELAKWGLVVLGIVAALTLLAAGGVGVAALRGKSAFSQRVVSDAIRGGIVLRMGTIFGMVMTAGVLSLTGALTEGMITFLSGISGYVLGSIQRQSGPRPREAESPREEPTETPPGGNG
jgi:hypothetical protein